MRVLLAGGGTAGHINPAISIANYIKKNDRDSKFIFLGTMAGMEKELVPKAGFDIKFIDIRGFKRSISLENIKTVAKIFKAKAQTKAIMKEFKPDIVICTGGYVSGPVMAAAKSMKIPSIIHEQNVIPGVAVKMAVKYANKVAISFEETKKYFKNCKKCIVTGNPIRAELLTVDKEASRRKLGIDERPLVLAFGGSLGSDKINDAMIEYIKENINSSKYQIIFGCGKRNFDKVMAHMKEIGIDLDAHKEIRIRDYIDNMSEVMAAADIIISRSGAITVSEINAMGKVSILIPSPNVAHDHQTYNAMALYNNEAGIMIAESELSAKLLKTKIEKLLDNEAMYKKMAINSKKMGICDACAKIYNLAKIIVK